MTLCFHLSLLFYTHLHRKTKEEEKGGKKGGAIEALITEEYLVCDCLVVSVRYSQKLPTVDQIQPFKVIQR